MKNKKAVKSIFSFIMMIISGVFYIVKSIFILLDTNVPKLFMKTPRPFRQVVIYTMIILSVGCFMGREEEKTVITQKIEYITKEMKNKEDNNSKIETKQEEQQEETVEELPQEEEVEAEPKCQLSEIECKIFDESIGYGMTEEQAYMVLAISKQETGRWTSEAFKNGNNLGGIMGINGLRSYDTLEQGIQSMVHLLKDYYIDKGLDTLEKIQTKYCPIGASNDPTGLNNYWLKNTTIFYNEYLERK